MSGNKDKDNLSSFSLHSSSSSSSSSSSNDDDDSNNNNKSNNLDSRMIHQASSWRRPAGLWKSSTSNSLNFLVAMLMYTFLLVLFLAPTTTTATTTSTAATVSVKNGEAILPSQATHENENQMRTIPHLTLDRLESKLSKSKSTVNGSPSSAFSSSSSSVLADSRPKFRDLNLIWNENNPNGKSQYLTSSSKSTLSSSSDPDISGQISRILNWKRQFGLGPFHRHRILRQTSQQVQDPESPNSDYWNAKQKKGFSVISRLYPYIVGRDQQTPNRKEVGSLQQRSFVNEDSSPMVQMRRSSTTASQRPYRFRLRWG